MTESKQSPSPATFTFVLTGSGWAEARLQSGDVSLEFVISYLCHPLADLLEGLVSLLDEGGKWCLEWKGEPWGYQWEMELLPDFLVRIAVSYTDESLFSGSETQWERRATLVLDLRDLSRQAVRQAEAVLRDTGFAAYKRQWLGCEFPLAHLLELRASLEGRNPEMFSKSHGSIFEAELAYLSRLLPTGREDDVEGQQRGG